jgi:hypothetical protein
MHVGLRLTYVDLCSSNIKFFEWEEVAYGGKTVVLIQVWLRDNTGGCFSDLIVNLWGHAILQYAG